MVWKATATITWEFEACQETCRDKAKETLDGLLSGAAPAGLTEAGLRVEKVKGVQIHLGDFSLEDVLPHAAEGRRVYRVNGEAYSVRMDSERYKVFAENNRCVACGLEGVKMSLEMTGGDGSPHFNMYGFEDGRPVLMTKDHIVPKSKRGTNRLDNFRTMCSRCNGVRGNHDLTLEQIRELRHLAVRNPDRLTRKELAEEINKLRDFYAAQAEGNGSRQRSSDDDQRGHPETGRGDGRGSATLAEEG